MKVYCIFRVGDEGADKLLVICHSEEKAQELIVILSHDGDNVYFEEWDVAE